MSEASPSLRAASARRAPHRLEGALGGAVGAVALALALRDPPANGAAAGVLLLAALAGALARRALAPLPAALPGPLRPRLRRTLAVADGAEAASAALATALMLARPEWCALLCAGLAGLLLMGGLARLTLRLVLRRALDEPDDPDAR